MSTGTIQSNSERYVVACTVHGVKRWFDGCDSFTQDIADASVYSSKKTAQAVARDQAYKCVVEPAP